MDLKVLILFLGVTFTTIQGAIPKCCVVTTQFIPLTTLRKVERYDVQNSNGACEIDALVLHVKGKKYCADPKVKRILRGIQHHRMEKLHQKMGWIMRK